MILGSVYFVLLLLVLTDVTCTWFLSSFTNFFSRMALYTSMFLRHFKCFE